MLLWLELIQSLPQPDRVSDNVEPIRLEPQTARSEAIPIAQATPVERSLDVRTLRSQLGGGDLGFFAVLIAALIILLIVAALAYAQLYKVTPANEAFVKTGGIFRKRRVVIKQGGCLVLPIFDELTRIPLKEISIDVERTGKLAVRTQDYLRADMRVAFYVCINAIDDDIKTATERLSQNGIIAETDIKNAIEKRADDAIRAAAKNKNLADIDSDKLGFAQEVLNLIEPDLKRIGLTLNNIAISEIEESDTYDTNNFFDAQGVRLRTETIQKSVQQQREVELSTRVSIEQKELEAQKRSLTIQQEDESAQLQQEFEVESLRATRAREIQETKDKESANQERNQILQRQAVEEEQIRKKLAVEQQQIDAEIELEERQKKLKVAKALQQQEAEMAEINRKQTIDANRLKAQVEVAEAEQMSQIAKQEAAIAIARKEEERFAAEAERAKAEGGVTTATEIEKAERQQRLAAIAAEREAQERRIADQNVVEIDVYRRKRQAEIARESADLEAESIRTLAEANRDKDLAEAEGAEARIRAENAISDANRTAQVITDLAPQLIEQLPDILKALAPQPGVLGDARVYAFPGGGGDRDGNSARGINQLLFSTSSLSLINALFEEGKLGMLLDRLLQLVRGRDGNLSDAIDRLTSTDPSKTAPPPPPRVPYSQFQQAAVESPPSDPPASPAPSDDSTPSPSDREANEEGWDN
jgi:uncharacterized membrane protein YqiK